MKINEPKYAKWIINAANKYQTSPKMIDAIWTCGQFEYSLKLKENAKAENSIQYNRFFINGDLNDLGKEIYSFAEEQRRQYIGNELRAKNENLI